MVVDDGWSIAQAGAYFPFLVADRESVGPPGTPQHLVRKIVHLRWKKSLGPVAIGAKLGIPASTVHIVLVRCRLNRLHHVDVRTGEPIRRYEHEKPGAMIHVDVKSSATSLTAADGATSAASKV